MVCVNISGLPAGKIGVLDCHSGILQRFLHLRSVEQTIADHQAALRLTGLLQAIYSKRQK